MWTTNWWGGMGLARHLLRLLGMGGAGRPVEAEVRWAPAPVRGEDRKTLAAAVRAEMARTFRPHAWEPVPADLPWPALLVELESTRGRRREAPGEGGGGAPRRPGEGPGRSQDGDPRPESATPL